MSWNFPGALVFFSLIPPFEAVGELLELDGLGLGVVLPALGQRLLVVPDFFGRAGAVEEQQVGRDAGVGREDAVGQADDGVQVELLEQFLLDAGADAVAEERAVGHDDGGAAGLRLALQLAHDELQEQQRGFGGLLVLGEVAVDAALLLAAEGRVGQDHIHAVSVADLAQREAQAVARIDLRRLQAVQEQVHLASRYGSGLASPPKMLCFCRICAVLDRLALLLQVLERLDEKAAGAAGRVEDVFAELRVDDLDHEAHDGARRVELAGVAGRVAHLLEHRLVEVAERVDLLAAGEVDAVDLVDHVAQQVAADHAVDHAFEDGGDHIAPVAAVGALQAAQIGEEPGAFLAVRPDGFLVVDEGDQLVAGDAVGLAAQSRQR